MNTKLKINSSMIFNHHNSELLREITEGICAQPAILEKVINENYEDPITDVYISFEDDIEAEIGIKKFIDRYYTPLESYYNIRQGELTLSIETENVQLAQLVNDFNHEKLKEDFIKLGTVVECVMDENEMMAIKLSELYAAFNDLLESLHSKKIIELVPEQVKTIH